ncbi:hypothetical protein [Psychrobacillus sp. NPDC096389]|uniref:hypothetical protein n=1 Tax=Psychrobacillus sp. NPDC096389 TaxID=3364490 RepID=UPI0038067DE5
MDTKMIWKFVTYTGLAMIIFPVIINGLMFFNFLPVSGDEFTWISSLSTFWGAIIGGIISGTLTLIGVQMSVKASFKGLKLTIEHQESENFKESVGLKLSKLYEVKNIIYTLDRKLSNWGFSWNDNYEIVDRGILESEIRTYIFPRFNVLLEVSSSVDYEFYYEIKSFVDKARKSFYSEDEPNYNELTVITEKLTKDIEDNHETRISEKYRLLSGK